jgi:hypothetical protein
MGGAVAASFETPAYGGLLRLRSETPMVRSVSSRVSNHEGHRRCDNRKYNNGRGPVTSRGRHF